MNRGIRHQTLICCITAAGLLLVSPDPAVRKVFDQGVRESIDLRIEIAPSPYANAEIFDHYCYTVLIPVGHRLARLRDLKTKLHYYFVTTVRLIVQIIFSENLHVMESSF
jgi:hypothetical protein